jgi:type II secretory pathway component GspD/PulD (secretin)
MPVNAQAIAPATATATKPATRPATAPATAPASAPATTKPAAKKPSADELLSKDPIEVSFQDAPLADALETLAKKCNATLQDEYVKKFSEHRLTLSLGKVPPADAIKAVSGVLQSFGYQLATNVRGDPARVEITVMPDSSSKVTENRNYFKPTDPDNIPETDEIRSQVFQLVKADPQKAKKQISELVPTADITIDDASNLLIVTDTSSHVHTAAVLLQLLEKQASGK